MEDQVDSHIHVDMLEVEEGIVLRFLTVVVSEWSRYHDMRVDWDYKICNTNLHMAYVQVWAHDLYRCTVLAVVVG